MNHGPRRIDAVHSPRMVSHPEELTSMVTGLSRQPRFALDTESDSFYAYYPKVCLIQITTFADAHNPDSEHVVDYLVDTLSPMSLEPLGELLASGQQEVVMHAAENDIVTLRRGFGFHIARVFDTQLAARILGQTQVGLGAMLEAYFGVVSDKRMQRTDWSARPLTTQQIAYAQTDTHYLLALRDLLVAELRKAGHIEEAADAFRSLVIQNGTDKSPPPRTFWQMKAAHRGNHADLAVLESLWEWREAEAQEQNRPPFKVMSDDALTELAREQPTSLEQVQQVSGLSHLQQARYGAAVVSAVREGKGRPTPEPPKPPQRPDLALSPDDQNRFERLRRWRTAMAQSRGVAPEIVFNNETLYEVALRNPRSLAELAEIPGISPWKAKTYGEELLALSRGR